MENCIDRPLDEIEVLAVQEGMRILSSWGEQFNLHDWSVEEVLDGYDPAGTTTHTCPPILLAMMCGCKLLTVTPDYMGMCWPDGMRYAKFKRTDAAPGMLLAGPALKKYLREMQNADTTP